MTQDVKIIRSSRKTFGLKMTPEGLVVHAPLHATQMEIDALLEKHRRWISNAGERLAQQQQQAAALPPLTKAELHTLTAAAKTAIPPRVAHFAGLLGVTYGRITIRSQRSRWGSCSAKGNLNFNCLLMLAPPQVLDSVVVHELCHRKQMNHSTAFYREVYRVMPDYDRWNGWLKQNGPALVQRMTNGAEETEDDAT